LSVKCRTVAAVQRRDPQAVVEDVGRRIAEVRQLGEMTQEECAEKLGISLRHMKRLEAGHNMTIFTLARVASAFGISPASLLATPRSSAPRRPGRPPERRRGRLKQRAT
jgi:transcriptional regulator with XRE-family HTH domain